MPCRQLPLVGTLKKDLNRSFCNGQDWPSTLSKEHTARIIVDETELGSGCSTSSSTVFEPLATVGMVTIRPKHGFVMNEHHNK